MQNNSPLQIDALVFPVLLLLGMWVGYLFQYLNLVPDCFGAIIPLLPEGLKGVFLSPLLHGSLDHLLSNSFPILILSFLLYQFYPKIANRTLLIGWITTGLVVWLLPPIDFYTGMRSTYACIIGASGLVYLLAFFLFFSGVFRWDLKLLAVSLAVAFYYGSLIWGIFPEEYFQQLEAPSRVSWQSHLAGAVVGLVLAFLMRRSGGRKKKFLWQYPNYYSEKDDRLWQEYILKHPEDFNEMPQKKKDPVWDRLEELRNKE